MKLHKKQHWVVYLATFPPRECGIATFTKDLTDSIDDLVSPTIQSKIIAMNLNKLTRFPYSKKVIYQIDQPDQKSYITTAKKLNNLAQVKMVVIQHEFGIFGGENGSYVLDFMEAFKKPIVVTFHSVLPYPNPHLQSIVQKIVLKATKIIVMTNLSKEVLIRDYGSEPEKIVVIPHGIHPCEFESSFHEKTDLDFKNNLILSTFGLLSNGKGIEYVLRALPKVIKEFPHVQYLIIGATHPVVLKKEGEKYRNFLEKEIKRLSICQNVKFYNEYFTVPKLIKFLKATDIYISTSLNPNQAVSGTLSYAMGTGRPIISTSFAQAKEDITPKVGYLVDFKKPKEYTEKILNLLRDKKLRWKMARTAYFETRNMTWPNVASAHFSLFKKIVPEFSHIDKKLPEIRLDHVIKMTDDFGMLQFSELTEPNIKWGYTLDDNVRALMVAGLAYEIEKDRSKLKLMNTYLNFIDTVAKNDGHYFNYVDLKKRIDIKRNEKVSLEDSEARAFKTLGWLSVNKAIPQSYRLRAKKLFLSTLKKRIIFSSSRAISFHIQGLYYWWQESHDTRVEVLIEYYCDLLVKNFKLNSDESWLWFEDCLTYSNSIICEALLNGYTVTQNEEYFKVSKKTLDFLISVTFINDIFVPIGQNGWYRKNGERSYYDQQPEEVACMISTLKEMNLITKDFHYKELMKKAYNWFLGENTLGLEVYDRVSKGCYDGVGKEYLNLNQGAESTISYLLARLSFEGKSRISRSAFNSSLKKKKGLVKDLHALRIVRT